MIRDLFVALWASLLTLACASAPRPIPIRPLVPPSMDVSVLAPPEPLPIKIPDDVPNFPDQAINDGQCPGMPGGILLSERRYAESIEIESERNRLRVEGRAMRELDGKKSRAIEDLNELLRRSERDHAAHEDALERKATIRLWLGVAAGAGAVLLGGWAVSKVARQ